MTELEPPPLIHLRTLASPSGITRAWSSRPHPSAKSPLLATASSDKSVQIWDLRDYRLLSSINGGHKRSVRCVGWKNWGLPASTQNQRSMETHDAQQDDAPVLAREKPVTLATGSFDSNVGVWIYHPQTGRTNGLSAGDAMDEFDMTNPPDNEEENEDDWHFTTLLTGPDSEIKDLQFSPPHYGANLLATCSRDKSVWVWEEVEDDNEWETIAVLAEHTGDVKCVSWCSGVSTQIDGESVIVGSREILATGSYDDTIRLWRDVEEEGDWLCVAVMTGHQGTVWDVCWESYFDPELIREDFEIRDWEPRLLSCSDDMSIRLWRRELSESEREKKRARLANGVGGEKQDRLPSIIRPQSTMERWVQDSTLPTAHVRTIYAVDWSSVTGLVVSCGGDGTIAVYKEVLDSKTKTPATASDSTTEDVQMHDANEQEKGQEQDPLHANTDSGRRPTKWIIAAVIEAAHEEYEVNHVCWAPRRDADKRWDTEQVIVSTGDDGDVKIWTLPEGILQR